MFNFLSGQLRSAIEMVGRYLHPRREPAPEHPPVTSQLTLDSEASTSSTQPTQQQLSERKVKLRTGRKRTASLPPDSSPKTKEKRYGHHSHTPQPGLEPTTLAPVGESNTSSALSRTNFDALKDGGWLDDLTIDTTLDRFYKGLQGEHNTGLLDSFFYKSFVDKNQLRFPKRMDTTLTASRVFWPCNANSHWFLVVVDNRDHCIRVIDSLYTDSPANSETCATHIQHWQAQFLRSRNLNQQADQVAQYPIVRQSLPRQRNYDDCGVALLWAAERLFRGENELGEFNDPSPYADYRQQLVPFFHPRDDAIVFV